MPSTEILPAGGDVLLDLHVRITEADDLDGVTIADADRGLL
jgi:hypothetical protein